MCTLTWIFNEDCEGYSLFFNRDELKTRQRAIPPHLKQTEHGIHFLAPTDTDAGGTWIAVNQYGLTVCLLNNYEAAEPETGELRSRGEIVLALAGCETPDAAEQVLMAMDLSCYRGFSVVLLQADARQFSWDVTTLRELSPQLPITSSSYHSTEVCSTRKAYFDSLRQQGPMDIDALERFHRSHINDDLSTIDGKPVYANSVCMHRDNAQTVSQCFVQVNPNQVSIAYSDGSPCETVSGPPQVLQRRVAA